MRAGLGSDHVQALLVQGVSAVFGFTTFVLFARWMGPEKLGVLILFITASTMLDMLRSGFLQPAMVREIRGRDEKEGRSVRGSALLLGLMWSTVSAVIILGISVTGILGLITSETQLFGVVWPACILSTFPVQYFAWQAQAESRFDRILVHRFAKGSIVLCSTIALYMADMLSPVTVGWSFVLSGVVNGSLVTLARWIRPKEVMHASIQSMKVLARFGRYSMTTTFGASLLRSSDTFLIGALLDTTAVAIYGVAQKAVEILDLPLRALSASVYPVMAGPGARGEATKVGRIIERVSSGYLLAIFAPALGLFVLANPLVLFVAGPDYLEAVPVIRVFVIAAFLLPVDRMIGLGLDSLGRPDVNLLKVSLMLTCNVVGDVLVLYVWGSLTSVAMVTVFMSTVGLLTGWIILQPMARLSWRRSRGTLRYWFTPAYLMMQLAKSGRRVHESNA